MSSWIGYALRTRRWQVISYGTWRATYIAYTHLRRRNCWNILRSHLADRARMRKLLITSSRGLYTLEFQLVSILLNEFLVQHFPHCLHNTPKRRYRMRKCKEYSSIRCSEDDLPRAMSSKPCVYLTIGSSARQVVRQRRSCSHSQL